MKRAMWVALATGTLISSAAAVGIGASSAHAPQSLTRDEFSSALAALDERRGQVLARCEGRASAVREICRAEAGAEELLRSADLEVNFRGTQDSARGAQRSRVEARYYVERAKCAAVGGVKRDRCLIDAHAARGVALLELAAPYDTRS